MFVGRLAGTDLFDPLGDRVGKVRDVVVRLRSERKRPDVIGVVVEMTGHRRVFLPITRVTTVAPRQVVSTGLMNLQRFERRPGESLVIEDLFDRRVQVRGASGPEDAIVFDVGIEPGRGRGWEVSKVAVTKRAGRFARRQENRIVEWDLVDGLAPAEAGQGVANLLAALAQMRAPDLAEALIGMSAKRRREVVAAMDDERLADVLEELDHRDQADLLAGLTQERAADVLEAMGPDDAADLLSELPPEQAETLLGLMEPDEADPVRRLLSYSDDTAGGLMTSEPVVVPPGATIAEVLATLRNPDLTPALAAVAFVARPPVETPTGRFLGSAHFQRLLREPPSNLVSAVVDTDPAPLRPEASLAEVTQYLATYNLVAAPVVDPEGHLLGAVSVDDVLDHLLPETWRRTRNVGVPDGA